MDAEHEKLGFEPKNWAKTAQKRGKNRPEKIQTHSGKIQNRSGKIQNRSGNFQNESGST